MRGAVSQAPGKQAAPEPGAPNPAGGFTPPGGAKGASPKAGSDGVYDGITKEMYDALPSGAHWRKPGDPPGTYRQKLD